MEISTKLTVFFDDPFWVGVCERTVDGSLAACRVVFGSEPRDYEVYAFILADWNRLSFSPPVEAGKTPAHKVNPKRMRRAIAQSLRREKGIGTKAQQALKEAREQNKTEHQQQSRAQREQEKELQFALRQQKKKEKRKGH